MATKVVVHSTGKRLLQVIVGAVLLAAALTGLKKGANAWRATEPGTVPPGIAEPSFEAGTPSPADTQALIVGRSSVVDADTLEISGVRIRLEGVDALESSQACGAGDTQWRCGQQAALALDEWLAGRTVSCRPTGVDRYQRTLARCFVGAEDIQSWLVLNGWAMAYRQYSTDYVAAEDVARQRKVGMWAGEFHPPWDWRRRRR